MGEGEERGITLVAREGGRSPQVGHSERGPVSCEVLPSRTRCLEPDDQRRGSRASKEETAGDLGIWLGFLEELGLLAGGSRGARRLCHIRWAPRLHTVPTGTQTVLCLSPAPGTAPSPSGETLPSPPRGCTSSAAAAGRVVGTPLGFWSPHHHPPLPLPSPTLLPH